MATSTGKFTDGVWGPKHYILAAIAVTLAVSAVAVVTSVILSPARIVFSVTATSTNQLQPPGRAGVDPKLHPGRRQPEPPRGGGVQLPHGSAAGVQREPRGCRVGADGGPPRHAAPPAAGELELLPGVGLLRPEFRGR
uniref:Uncharacterized protein n=1 Tax=Aegilops tauschii TaxID=37682 RepID=M8BE37_AEGTA